MVFHRVLKSLVHLSLSHSLQMKLPNGACILYTDSSQEENTEESVVCVSLLLTWGFSNGTRRGILQAGRVEEAKKVIVQY